MQRYTKYWPLLLGLILFLAGRYSVPDNDPELKAKFQEERLRDREAISGLLHENTQLKARMATREKDHKKDSTTRAEALARQESIMAALKKENERINYKSYSNPDLDSIDAILFGAR